MEHTEKNKNNEKIKISRVVLCEGKYDKIKLSAVIDGMILTTDGFAIFNDREKQALLRRLCAERGLVIITDSDRAGFFIRNKLKGYLADGDMKQIYIPQIRGREKRKEKDSKDGLLGVEGMPPETLRNLLRQAGIEEETTECPCAMSKAKLYAMGLSGGKDSAALRKKVCRALGLPESLSTNAFAEACAMLRIGEATVEEVLCSLRESEGMR